jgi:Peptidase family C25/Propeptide_C25/Secretion system C-terminal sorting domain
MKNLSFILILFLGAFLCADWIAIESNQTVDLVTCNQTRNSEIELNFSLDGYEQEIINYLGTQYTRISHPDAGRLGEEGLPDLPVFTRMIALPNQGDISLEILSQQSIISQNMIIYPCEKLLAEHDSSDNFAIDEAYYYHGGRFPEENALAGEPAIMRDIRLLPVTFCPFHYNAATGELEIITSLSIKITISENNGANCKTQLSALSRNFESLYQSNILNYESSMLRDDYQQPVILYICPDDEDVLENLQPLLDWKRQKGFIVEVVTTAETGEDSANIKDYIQTAYNNWDNPPEYICLAGDANGEYPVATHFLYTDYDGGEGDQFYGELEGDDCFLDAHVGRLSYSTIEELQIIVAKILYYEKNPYMDNTDWLQHSLLVGDPSSMGYITIENTLSIKELMLEFPDNWEDNDNFYEIYDGNFPNQMNTALENGVSYMFYRGYMSVSGWDPGTQENDFMLPFTTIIGCSTGNFAQSAVSDPETMLRMGTVDIPRGAIGAIGQTTCADHTYLASALTIGMTSSLLVDQAHSMGAVLTGGKMTMSQVYPTYEYVSVYVNLISLMGDPSLDLWTKVPENLTVICPQQILFGDNWLPVQVLDDQNEPVSNAWVTLTAENPLDFGVSAFTDQAGYTILPVENISQGSYKLTVTYPDFIPVQNSIEVVNANYIAEISEALFTEFIGNGDELLNPGETFYLDISLTNYGYQTISQVSAILSSSSSFIDIPGNQLIYGNISGGGTANPAEDFIFEIDPAALDGMEAEFELSITDDSGNEWLSWLSAEISGPSVYCSYYSFGGDGILDPGETTDLYIELTNNGSVFTPETQATLSCYDRGIVIIDNHSSFDPIYPGEAGNNLNDTFTISASEYLLPGSQINLIVTLHNTSGFNCPVQFSTPLGTPQVTDPCHNDTYGYICFDDEDTDYEMCPEYDWIEINPDLGGEGESIPMYTGAWNGQSEVIDLPDNFNFKFYGEDYQQLTICSNGWVAPGSHETASYCNWYLPSPQGPSPIIAVFWDDLRVMDNDDNISWYYDAINHWVIVEWYLPEDNYSNDNIFQVILYDYLYYPALEDNSDIKMQYGVIDNTNYSNNIQYHGQYATIGLENSDSSSGLLYTYNNQYDVTNKALENEMSLFYTCSTNDYDLPYLRVDQIEIQAGDDEYIEADETVYLDLRLINNSLFAAHNIDLEISCTDQYIDITQANAHIDFIDVHELVETPSPLIFNVLEDVPDFHEFLINLHIESDEGIWDRYIPLTAYHPNIFSIDQDSIYVEMNLNQTESQEFTLTNIGDNPVDFYASTREIDPPERDISDAWLTCSADHFTPGETTNWIFTIYNGSANDEWITDLWIEFPYEITLNYATDAVGGSGGDLVWDGTTGSEANVDWFGITPSGYGVIREGETASFTANVTINDQYAGNIDLFWQICGDGFGAEPHTVTGDIILQSPLRWIDIDISHGILQPDESQTFIIDLDSSELIPGIYNAEILIASDNWDSKSLPVTLNVLFNEEHSDQIPEFSGLLGNYPNPFNPSTTINFVVCLEDSPVKITIYNIKGQFVQTLVDKPYSAGKHQIAWSTEALPSGVYLCQVKIDGKTFNQKMLLTK